MGIVPKAPDTSHGNKAEKKLNKRLGGRQTFASGALVFDKGDIVLPEFRIECKSTVTNTLSVKYGWLNKISSEALDHAKHPALSLQFVHGDGTAKKNGSWVAITEREFKEYLDLKEQYGGEV